MSTVIMPLPDRDFDVTESAVPWRLLTDAGHEVVFATERGDVTPAADPLLLSGVVFGQLGAAPEPKRLYAEMIQTAAFQRPISWREADFARFDALILPGGHAQGMKQFLGDEGLIRQIAAFFELNRPVGAICHGVLPAARSGALKHRRTTALPRYMELIAWGLTAWKLGNYYRTYPQTVEEEVRAALATPEQFLRGPISLIAKDTAQDHGPAFVVEDGLYVSARWPGDAYRFGAALVALLERPQQPLAEPGEP